MGVVGALLGCSPSLDWREVGLPGSALVVELPCRPGRFEREIDLGAQRVKLMLLTCEAQGITFGAATAELGDPTRVETALAALAEATRHGMRVEDFTTSRLALPGMTPYSGNVIAHIRAVGPDGRPVLQSVQIFARGSRIFEVSAIGRELPPAVLGPFEDGVHFELDRTAGGPAGVSEGQGRDTRLSRNSVGMPGLAPRMPASVRSAWTAIALRLPR